MRSVLRSVPPLTGRPRTVIAAGPFLAVIVAFAGIYTAVSGRLPDPLATHFRFGGQADGFTSVQGFLAGSLALFLLLGAVVGFLVQLRPAAPGAVGDRRRLRHRRLNWLRRLCDAAQQRRRGRCVGRPGAAVGGVPQPRRGAVRGGAGAAARRRGARRALAAARCGVPARPSRRRDGRLVTHHRSPPLAVLGGLLLVGGLLIGLFADWIASAGLLFGAAVSLPLASVRVTVDRRGLTLAPALLSSRCRFRRIPWTASRRPAAGASPASPSSAAGATASGPVAAASCCARGGHCGTADQRQGVRGDGR